jgi:hypothetical protein
MANTSAALKNAMKYTYGMPTTGHQKMGDVAVLSQYLQVSPQSDLKYCQVVAQVAHQAVTMITVLVGKAVITAQRHCKNQ